MTIVTINGQRGSGAPEIGMEVASRLQYAYVDRQVLGEAAKRLGTTEEALEEKELSALTGSRILRALTRIINRMGASGAIGDPFSPFGLGQDYGELMAQRAVGDQRTDDERFLEAANNVAWVLSTRPEAELRDGAGALLIAQELSARTGYRELVYLETLAAAFAETGDFDAAMRTTETAIEIARRTGESRAAAALSVRLELYREGRPGRSSNR